MFRLQRQKSPTRLCEARPKGVTKQSAALVQCGVTDRTKSIIKTLCPLLCLMLTAAWAVADNHHPNILLIVSEDNGPELGCYGEPHVRTPVLDKLAAQGVRFNRAFVAQAGCSQSRAAYLTGLYPHQNGQIGLATWGFQMYREDTPNIVRSLKQAGYRTGIIGKLHINPAEAFPFDFKEIPSSNFSRKNLNRYAEAAAEFFGQSDTPFFLSINYPDAHRPFLRQVGKLPKNPLDTQAIPPLLYMGLDSPKLREDTVDYYNCMERLDTLIGDLLDTLDASGKADNTLVVYFGDHGADLLRGKRTSYEGGVRVPMIARWPGHMKAGQVREELTSTLDLAPTFLAAANATPVPHLPGRSLLPLIKGENVPWRQYLYTEYHLHSAHNYYPQRTVRDDRFKLIWNLLPGEVNPGFDFTIDKFLSHAELNAALAETTEDVRRAYEQMRRPPQFELYDLQNDPYEFRNLAEDPAHAKTLERLTMQLQSWREQTNDPFLNHDNVLRLQAEIAATEKDGKYTKKKEPWGYVTYTDPKIHAVPSAETHTEFRAEAST